MPAFTPMLRLVRFLPLLLVVAFVAWCSQSNRQHADAGPLRVELAELFQQQGLLSGPVSRDGGLAEAAKRAGPAGMNQLLYESAAGASVEALRWIVAHGADPANVASPGGVPLLHKAAQRPGQARLAYFLGLGLDARQRDGGGNTLLHVTARAGLDEPVLQLLLAKGLKLTDANAAGQLPLHVASLKSLDLLVRAGAEVDAVDALGRTALHSAAAERRADLVAELVRLGASVFKADAQGRTPLHLAALARAEPVVDVLLAAGAPRSARDADGLTARDLALARLPSDRRRGLADKL
jgi:ankyrin repeat protein